jgi:hypothetical protein
MGRHCAIARFIIALVKLLALLFLVASQCACTTLVNQRDLYSPQPSPDSHEATREMTAKPAATAAPKPEFR